MQQTFLKEENGSGLVTVLVLLTVVSLLLGSFMGIYVLQNKLVKRDTQRTQARYAAEAGLEWAMSELETNASWKTNAPLILNHNPHIEAEIQIVPRGAFWEVTSTGKTRHATVKLIATIGAIPTNDWNSALVMGDTHSDIFFVGNTQLRGDLVMPPVKLETRTFNGFAFTGSHLGNVIRRTPSMPNYDDALMEQSIASWERMLRGNEGTLLGGTIQDTAILEASPQQKNTFYTQGDLAISFSKPIQRTSPMVLIVQGNLRISGKTILPEGSTIVASGDVILEDEVQVEDVVFYAKNNMLIMDQFRGSGQFIAGKTLILQNKTYLTYPSLVYLRGDEQEISGQGRMRYGTIRLLDQVKVDGLILYPPSKNVPPERDEGRIFLGEETLVRGGIYAARQTEAKGKIWGTLMTHQTYFYDTPTVYLNWVRDVNIDRTKRPPSYLLPIGFRSFHDTTKPRLELMRLYEE